MSGHARLSASAAERWMNCPGSVALQPAGRRSSRAAAEGTFAHEMAARALAGEGAPPLGLRATVEGFDFEVDDEMLAAVQTYCDAVKPWVGPLFDSRIEVKLTDKLRGVHPDFGGTADFVSYNPAAAQLLVADFKYGAGTFVSEEDNRQLKIYALGALLTIGKPATTVTVMIVQPRYEGAEPVRTWSFDAFDLMDFMADLKAAAAKTREKDAPTVAGPWCRKTFCAAAATCPATEKAQTDLILRQFHEVEAYDPVALAKGLDLIPVVKERIKQLEEFAYSQATMGAKIPGYKLVNKVARRQWTADEAQVAKWAAERGVEPFQQSMKSPAQMEKDLNKTQKVEMATMVASVSSGTTLVPVGDKRPEVGAAVSADDFTVIGAADLKRLKLFD